MSLAITSFRRLFPGGPKTLLAIVVALAAIGAKSKSPPAKEKSIVERVLDIERPKNDPSSADEEPDTPSGDAMYAGGCVDSKGVSVRWEANPKIADAAQALFDKKKRPLIQYNPNKLRFLHDASRAFFFAHECAHHALGHLYGGVQGADKEQQADCWAVHRLKMDDKLDDDGLEHIQQDLGTIGRIDKNHTAGVRRASNLKWCLRDPMPKPPEPKTGEAKPGEQKSETK